MRVSSYARGWREVRLFLERESKEMFVREIIGKVAVDSKEFSERSLRTNDCI